MHSARLPFLFAAVVAVCSAANLTTTGCADAAGLQLCLNTAASTANTCNADAEANGSKLELLACGCQFYVDNFNCYASHCWNRVYECEYQEYIVEYLRLCPIAKLPAPYFPAPDKAPDSCSCNLGNVFLAFNNSVIQGNTCITSQPLGSYDKIQGCECCELSGAISRYGKFDRCGLIQYRNWRLTHEYRSIYSICPGTNPSLLGLSVFNSLETLLSTKFSSCNSYLSKYNCVEDLGFSSIASSGSYYATTNLPSSGTATLSNVDGAVTAPPSGSVFAYTQGGNQVYTITAASANNAAATTTGGGGGSGTGSAAAGSASPTSKNSSVGLRASVALEVWSSLLLSCWLL
ncbi:hypothetical protein GQ53DRAFT_208742 [Thozetella sp. PMI_491]|nr:hypothetical protein GQ53DRAFT_208742 [Thozetella sp. PMI_491]